MKTVKGHAIGSSGWRCCGEIIPTDFEVFCGEPFFIQYRKMCAVSRNNDRPICRIAVAAGAGKTSDMRDWSGAGMYTLCYRGICPVFTAICWILR